MRRYALVDFGGDLKEIETENPVPKGREVLVRVRRCGVCHSDIHMKHGYFDLGDGKRFRMSDRGVTLPLALGHEVLGEVVAIGDAVNDLSIGSTMLVHPWIGCMTCEACREGRENDCTQMAALGIVRDGGYASHMLVPDARFLVDVTGIDPDIVAPYACSGLTVYSALKKMLPIASGGWLAIMGAGGLGLSAVSIARAMGVERIVAVDIDARKLAVATSLGADVVINSSEGDASAALARATGGMLLSVLDTVGAPATTDLAVSNLRKTGTLIVVGLHGGTFSMPSVFLPQKALTVRGSYVGSCAELRELIALVRNGAVQSIPVSTRPMAEACQTLKDLEAGRIVGRVVLTTD